MSEMCVGRGVCWWSMRRREGGNRVKANGSVASVSRRLAKLFFFFSSRRRHTRCSRDWSSDVCSSDLLLVGRTACQLRPVWSPERTPFCGLCSRRTCAGGTPLFRQRACSAGSAVPGRTSICQSLETGAGQGVAKSGELNRAENCETTDQFRRLGVTAAGYLAGAATAEHLRFSGRPQRDDRGRTARSATRSEESRDRSQRIGPTTGAALPDLNAHKKLELSRAARTDRRRVHAAPVHRFLLSAGTEARCLQPGL